MALYTHYYHLDREPFSLSPDPGFIYFAPAHLEAMAQLLYAVEGRKGLATLTGEVGTGKTTLLRNLLESAGADVLTAYVVNPPRTRDELHAVLASEFGFELSARELWNLNLHRFLIDAFRRGATAIAVFDEAQELPIQVLEEIRLLSNLETAESKLLQVILVGQPEFDSILDSKRMRALRQRINLRYSLSPLTADETAEYIARRLKLAGADRSPFEREACRAIYRYTGGLPRLINLLCDRSMLIGYASNRRIIDAALVRTAARETRLELFQAPSTNHRARAKSGPRQAVRPSVPRLITSLIAAAAALSIGVLYEMYPGHLHAAIKHVKATIGTVLDRRQTAS